MVTLIIPPDGSFNFSFTAAYAESDPNNYREFNTTIKDIVMSQNYNVLHSSMGLSYRIIVSTPGVASFKLCIVYANLPKNAILVIEYGNTMLTYRMSRKIEILPFC